MRLFLHDDCTILRTECMPSLLIVFFMKSCRNACCVELCMSELQQNSGTSEGSFIPWKSTKYRNKFSII